MFSIGGFEIIFILFVTLLLFGSKQLPEIARFLGKSWREIKNTTEEICTELEKQSEKTESLNIKNNLNNKNKD